MGFLDLSNNVTSQKHMGFNGTQEFDNMNGYEFEYFCAKVLQRNGYQNVKVTRSSGDQGVDIIAYKDGQKYAIQCKNYSARVGNKPVQEVFAGKVFYKCDVAAVITNSTFTQGAIDLANATNVILWDRTQLIHMLGQRTKIVVRHSKEFDKSNTDKTIDKIHNIIKWIILAGIALLGIFVVFSTIIPR